MSDLIASCSLIKNKYEKRSDSHKNKTSTSAESSIHENEEYRREIERLRDQLRIADNNLLNTVPLRELENKDKLLNEKEKETARLTNEVERLQKELEKSDTQFLAYQNSVKDKLNELISVVNFYRKNGSK